MKIGEHCTGNNSAARRQKSRQVENDVKFWYRKPVDRRFERERIETCFQTSINFGLRCESLDSCNKFRKIRFLRENAESMEKSLIES